MIIFFLLDYTFYPYAFMCVNSSQKFLLVTSASVSNIMEN